LKFDPGLLVDRLAQAEIPVLRSTALAMTALAREAERVTARDIARVVLLDPLMTLKVLRFAETHRGPQQVADITTVEHAVMMHGIGAFLNLHRESPTIESVLADDPAALRGALSTVSRAQHAAVIARAIAQHRHDSESEELVVAALLHEMAELLLWCHLPREQEVIQSFLEAARGVRSAAAQRLVLGFAHGDVQLALARRWDLPELLRRLMDDEHARHPRVVNVTCAAALARHLEHGWNDPALPTDLETVRRMTGQDTAAAMLMVRNAALIAASAWRSTGITPVAAWLPIESRDAPAREIRPVSPGSPDRAALAASLQKLHTAPAAVDDEALAAWTLFTLQQGLGLPRVLYAAPATAERRRLEPRFRLVSGQGAGEWCRDLSMPLGGADLFSYLFHTPKGLLAAGDNRQRIAGLLLPDQRRAVGEGDFLLMSVFAGTEPRGIVLADRGGPENPISEELYLSAKAVCQTLSRRLTARNHH
jgi:HD-like signal output (HDOD) protein